MSDSPDDWLTKMMGEEDYIEDAGFTARVSQALPPPRQVRRRRRTAVVFGSALLGAFLALFVLPGSRVLVQAYSDLVSLVGNPDFSNPPILALSLVTMVFFAAFAVVRAESA